MNELLHKRTLTSKIFDIGNRQLGQFHIGHIHYPTGIGKNGALEDVDTTLSFNASSGIWSTTKASYDAEIDQYGRISFHNVGGTLTLDPLNTTVQAQPHTGNIWGNLGKGLIWRDVLGVGMHMYCEVRNGSLARIFRFEQKPSFNTIDLKMDLSNTNFALRPLRNKTITVSSALKFDTLTAGKDIHFRMPSAWNHRGEQTNISLRFYDSNGQLYVQKVIPQSFIDNTFTEQGAWLETDDVTSYYAGDGSGQADYTGTDFDVARSAANATSAAYGSATHICRSSFSTPNYTIRRLYLPVDTSGISDAATITSAIMYFKTAAVIAGSRTYVLILTTQTSPTAVVVGDYSALTLNSPVEGCSRVVDTTFVVDSFTPLTLNSNGIGWINKTGWTKLGLREGTSDIDNVAPTNNRYWSVYMPGSTGTDSDPYLEVTYTNSNVYKAFFGNRVTLNRFQRA